MNIAKILSLSTLSVSLLLLTGAGCSTVQMATNTNVVADTNANVVVNENENTNAVVANENTNTDQASEFDISDWLTYENEEYGFSFKYPSDWHVSDKTSIQIPGQYQLLITASKSYNPNDYEFIMYVEQTTLDDKYEQVRSGIINDSNKEVVSETSQSTISKTIKVNTKSSNTIMTQTMVEIENSVISYACAEQSDESMCKLLMDTFEITI